MDDNNAEHFAGQLREQMERFGLPYLKISVEARSTPFTDSEALLSVLSSKTEALVNALLWDTLSQKMTSPGFLLTQLEDHVDSLISLSDYLRIQHHKAKSGIDALIDEADSLISTLHPDEELVPQKKKALKPTPIPKIFSDTLKEVMDKKKRPGK